MIVQVFHDTYSIVTYQLSNEQYQRDAAVFVSLSST
jgi:hypothetical protein